MTRVTGLPTFRAVSEIAYIALGSNLGDRRAHLARARDAIAAIPECRVVGATQVEETEPLGGLASDGQLMAYEHQGFWQPMDTLREKNLLEELWASGRAPWKRWS